MSLSRVVYSVNVPSKPLAEQKKSLDQLVKNTNQVLLEIKSVFPFKLFPDFITIDEEKVTLTQCRFFFMKSVFPILIKDIMTVSASTSLFFGSLRFEIRGFEQDPEIIEYLKKSDALKARRIVTALMLCDKEGIDLSIMKNEDVVEKLEDIGKTETSLNYV